MGFGGPNLPNMGGGGGNQPQSLRDLYNYYKSGYAGAADIPALIADIWSDAGATPELVRFAQQVAYIDSGGYNPRAVGDNGESLGLWQLRDPNAPGGGLRGEFMQWATNNGLPADPYDPISTSMYVSWKTSNDPEAWRNWTPAREMLDEGSAPDAIEAGNLSARFAELGESGRQFDLGFGLQQQQFGLQQEESVFTRRLNLADFMENLRQLAFERVSDKMRLMQDADEQRDSRRLAAIQAAMEAAPLMVPQGLEGALSGTMAQLGSQIGVPSGGIGIPRVRLPIGEFAGAPQSVTAGGVEAALAPFMSTVNQPARTPLPVAP